MPLVSWNSLEQESWVDMYQIHQSIRQTDRQTERYVHASSSDTHFLKLVMPWDFDHVDFSTDVWLPTHLAFCFQNRAYIRNAPFSHILNPQISTQLFVCVVANITWYTSNYAWMITHKFVYNVLSRHIFTLAMEEGICKQFLF